MNYRFSKEFLFGAATSAHQVEGGNKNDWSEWEKKNAPKTTVSGKATDHYSRYKEDFRLAEEFGHNATRFSIEWSRIEPEEGKFNKAALAHYQDVVKTCRELGLEPFVTLWHWTIPLWLRDKGGVACGEFPNYFARYAEYIAKNIPGVKFWLTINEPEIYAANSYLKGRWPPNKKSFFSMLKALENMESGHKKAFGKIKRINPAAQVGIAKNNSYFESAGGPINWFLKKCADYFWNFLFLNRIKNEQDFIGLNYYFRNRINYGFNKNKNEKISDMGWELYPEGIYHCLLDLKRYGKPIYVTENGLADRKDEKREWFIKESLKNVLRAISDGVDVRGYLHWSLTDNFEWDKGFAPRFGLIEIDYKNFSRKPRPSAYAYKKIIEGEILQ